VKPCNRFTTSRNVLTLIWTNGDVPKIRECVMPVVLILSVKENNAKHAAKRKMSNFVIRERERERERSLEVIYVEHKHYFTRSKFNLIFTVCLTFRCYITYKRLVPFLSERILQHIQTRTYLTICSIIHDMRHFPKPHDPSTC
jgi:hypothetical protein